MLCADAGMGKSAFASALWKQLLTDKELLAAFFCRFGDLARSDSVKVIQSIAFQVASSLPECRADILKGAETLENLVSVNYLPELLYVYMMRFLVFIQINNGANVQVKDYFTHLLQIPLNECTMKFRPRLIIIDALDELNEEQRSLMIDIILRFLHLLPIWIKVFITSRPEKDIVDALKRYEPVMIEEKDPNHVQDLKQYVEEELRGKVSENDLAEAVKIFMVKSEGKFIYAANVMQVSIRDTDNLTLSQLRTALPNGLDMVYETNFVRMDKSLAHAVLTPLLQLLVASREPLSADFVAHLLHMSSADILVVASIIAPAFSLRSDNAGVRRFYLYHKSVVDWLLRNKNSPKSVPFNFDATACHALIVAKLTPLISGYGSPAWELPISCDYIYTHLLDHLHLAGRGNDLVEFVFRLDWLQKVVVVRGANNFFGDLKRFVGYLPNPELKLLVATIKLALPILRVSNCLLLLPAVHHLMQMFAYFNVVELMASRSILQKTALSLALQLHARLRLRVADTLQVTYANPVESFQLYSSVSAAREGLDVEAKNLVQGAVMVYVPEEESYGYYRLTNGGGYLSSNQVDEKACIFTPVACLETKLGHLVRQCEAWMRANLTYHPVRYDLPGPGSMELKVDLPKVRKFLLLIYVKRLKLSFCSQ